MSIMPLPPPAAEPMKSAEPNNAISGGIKVLALFGLGMLLGAGLMADPDAKNAAFVSEMAGNAAIYKTCLETEAWQSAQLNHVTGQLRDTRVKLDEIQSASTVLYEPNTDTSIALGIFGSFLGIPGALSSTLTKGLAGSQPRWVIPAKITPTAGPSFEGSYSWYYSATRRLDGPYTAEKVK